MEFNIVGQGDRLKGGYYYLYKETVDLKISDDFTSFQGTGLERTFPFKLKGKRQE